MCLLLVSHKQYTRSMLPVYSWGMERIIVCTVTIPFLLFFCAKGVACETSTESCRPRRQGILPAHFRDDLSDHDDDVSSVLSRNHWVGQEIRISGSTVSCVVCGYIPTVFFRKMPFHKNIYARNVHLNFFYDT